MLIRIVKMEFNPAYVEEFLNIFHASAPLIRAFEGCTNLELYQDKNQPNIIFTYSYWEGPENLENYRKSALFGETWKKTKVLFSGIPAAWSVERLWGS